MSKQPSHEANSYRGDSGDSGDTGSAADRAACLRSWMIHNAAKLQQWVAEAFQLRNQGLEDKDVGGCLENTSTTKHVEPRRRLLAGI